jgi:NodT family efflux transporter outer membrane factor (OMF) lipoprotein
LRKQLGQQRHLLAVLVGRFPSQQPSATFELASLRLPEELPVSLPSRLVEQRPDIRAAEAQLHAASAQIGVATANMLPTFTINGNAGFMNTALAGLLAPQNLFWTVAGNATQTIFDGGTLLHLREEAKENYQAAAWTYRGTVVTAVQNVSDSLHALQNDADALKAAHEFERAANISFEQARRQFQEGSINVLLLSTAQQGYLQATIQVVQARAARLADTAALFQALGGGWWNRAEPYQAQIVDVSTGDTRPIAEPPQTH